MTADVEQPAPSALVGVDAATLRRLAEGLDETARRIATTQPMGLAEWADRERECREASKILAALAQQPAAVDEALVEVTDDMVERGAVVLSNVLGDNCLCDAMRDDVRAVLTVALAQPQGEKQGDRP